MKIKGEEVKLRCIISGHEPEDYTDSGSEICKRCGAHEFYDGDHAYYEGLFAKWDFTIPYIYHQIKWRIYRWFERNAQRFIYAKCCCGGTCSIFGIKVGKHDECLPF